MAKSPPAHPPVVSGPTTYESGLSGQSSGGLTAPESAKSAVEVDSPAVRDSWRAGVHYERIVPLPRNRSQTGSVEVMEFFSYECTPCYMLEPHLVLWRRYRMSSCAEFVRVHGVYGPEPHASARLYYALQVLGREDLDGAVFDAIFRLGTLLEAKGDTGQTFERQLEFVRTHGITADEFTNAYYSSAVSSNVQRTRQLMRDYRVRTVPLMVIHGKYRSTPESAGGDAQLMNLVDDLVASEVRG